MRKHYKGKLQKWWSFTKYRYEKSVMKSKVTNKVILAVYIVAKHVHYE